MIVKKVERVYVNNAIKKLVCESEQRWMIFEEKWSRGKVFIFYIAFLCEALEWRRVWICERGKNEWDPKYM